MTKPDLLTDEHLDYLDELRDDGVTNMFGAAPYLERDFHISIQDASDILSYWMHTFSERHAV